jgi:hypothetical protein
MMAPTAAPRAMITESIPAIMIQPQYFAMPMMATVAPRQIVSQDTRSLSEPNCADSHDRLDVLERKVNMLDKRMQTILDAVELQTDLLTQMRAGGKPAGAPANP